MPIPLVHHPDYSFPFPERHRFPMEKFGLLADHMRSQGLLTAGNSYRPAPCRQAWLTQTHSPDYLARFAGNRLSARETRQMNLPWSPGLVRRTFLAPSGTVLTAQLALQHGVACHLAGGTHHAHFDYAAGFCILNDLAIAANVLLRQGGIKRVLIFDVDVHQGDGTAALLAVEPGAFTCSIHCERNFPFQKQVSDLDVALPDGMGDRDYLAVVSETLQKALELSRPDIVLYDAGVDVFQGDPLGKLNISEPGIRERDYQVLSELKRRGIPVATVIGGGYDDDRVKLARRHGIVVEEASRVFGSG
ncbi:histone deacetylase [Marinobacter vulgaris]|uniref:Histone deacetylase n=1 Tax=Marinobacter vulgaris TaxID=1928331 RepID=A0A2V3ZL38_9GAMM|nr:histone deacetylase [Marinobacter vulgaris]PXX91635.1 histone deacetylase [Marinobacter vulgaris]TSJ70862.1 histone deacetylase [Marinobacter vulgaris]